MCLCVFVFCCVLRGVRMIERATRLCHLQHLHDVLLGQAALWVCHEIMDVVELLCAPIWHHALQHSNPLDIIFAVFPKNSIIGALLMFNSSIPVECIGVAAACSPPPTSWAP